jgi:hypothetical protein
VLWNELFDRFGIKIRFAYRTFAWESEAKGKAHVHVVIIGFAAQNGTPKRIYECEGEQITATTVKNISPYLVEESGRAIENHEKPLCNVPEIGIGNKPIDGGNYLFTPEEKRAFLKLEPAARPFFRRWIGSVEFVNGIERWCLWLGDCTADELRNMPEAMKRVEAVAELRNKSTSGSTRKLAEKPTRFHVENMPKGRYLVIPEVSSEHRTYIPIGFLTPRTLCSNLVKILPNANIYHFGILTSAMHMAWVRQVCGRLKSDYRYSAKLVYNNYPWPQEPTEQQRARVETAAQAVLDAREEYLKKGAALADLYDPLVTPSRLVQAHRALDRDVDRCYRREPFHSDRQRVEFLFALYEKLTAPLLAAGKKNRRGR